MEDRGEASRKRKRARRRRGKSEEHNKPSHLNKTACEAQLQEEEDDSSMPKKSQGFSKTSNFLEKVSTFLVLVYILKRNSTFLINIYIYIYIDDMQMKARLSGGHFRMLNEKLYTCT